MSVVRLETRIVQPYPDEYHQLEWTFRLTCGDVSYTQTYPFYPKDLPTSERLQKWITAITAGTPFSDMWRYDDRDSEEHFVLGLDVGGDRVTFDGLSFPLSATKAPFLALLYSMKSWAVAHENGHM